MTAKQYLRKMYFFQKSIMNKQRQIQDLRLLAESTGAVRYDKDWVVSSLPQSAGYEDTVAALVDAENKLREDIVILLDMYKTGERIINSLEDPIDKLLMEMRYINHMRWEDIATELNYSVDHIYYRHRHALKKLKVNSFSQ